MATARRRGIARLAVALAGVSVVAACSESHAPPTELVDGTPTRVMATEFEGVRRPVIATVARMGAPAHSKCAAARGAMEVIERVGVTGSSITAIPGARRTAYACDASMPGATCGVAFARLRGGRALDPRLSLTCRDADGETVAFAWIETDQEVAYLVVTHDDYAEAYPALGRLPVRVSTMDVDLKTSTARFEVSEHARSGGLLRRYVLQPRVAG